MGVGQKIPEGYKQTEVGVIPEDWQFSEVGQISEKIGSGITPTGGSAIYKKSGRPFLRSQNVLWGKLNISDLAFISDEIHSTFASTEIKINDVLLNITGASIGRSAHATKSIVGGNVNQHVCIIRSKDRIVFSKFLSTLLVSPLIQKQIFSFQAGGNREGLNFQQVSRLCIPLPPLPEQKAIAKVLSDTDSLIESLDALIDKKKAIKQGAMQELLTGKRRLPGFAKSNGYKQTEVGVIPEDWEIYSIAELFSILRNASYSRAELSDSGEYGCIHYGDIHTRFSHLLDCDTHTLPALSHKQAAAYPLIKDGDLILADASEDYDGIGKSTEIINLGERKLIAGLHTMLLRPKESTFASRFLGYVQSIKIVKAQFERYATGLKVYGVSKSNLTKIQIPLPPLPEQKAIAKVLSDIDSEIDALEKKRNKYKQIKQGMMEQLLSGKVRLV